MRKAIFIDVDGTLINDNGIVPDSAKLAVRKARENGHLVFICTGRSISQIFPEILEVGFDGIIGAAGGYVEMDGKVLFHECIKKENVHQLVEFFTEHGVDFCLESNEGVFSGGNAKQRMRSHVEHVLREKPEAKEDIEKGFQPFHDMLIEGEELIREDINKITFLGAEMPFEMIEKEFESIFTVIPNSVSFFSGNSGELSIPGIHKATGIRKVIDHLKIRREDTFGYGDSMNDIEMMEFVQHGIAMGNALEVVKKAADDVTDSNDEDGIYNSFKKYGLI